MLPVYVSQPELEEVDDGMSLDCETNMAFISILPVRFIVEKAISS